MIYLFNQTEELIDVIDEASLIGFTHTIEINHFDRSNFEIPVDYKPDIIKQAQFFGFQSRGGAFCLFKIAEKSYNVGLSIEGIDRAESDLHSFIIEDKRPGGTADQVLATILERTGYEVGDKDGLTITGNLSLYYLSARQALVKLIEAFRCEFRTRYTFVENKIIGRYIDLYQRFGKVTGHQFEYGSNILNVTYEEDGDDVVTALIGRGKGEAKTDSDGEATGGYGRRIQFTDVVWSKANGDPTDKPAGQNYVTNEISKNIYGLHQNGVIKHRFGVYTNENIDNPVELLKATYKELQRVSVPITTFKANLLDLTNEAGQDMWIGDSVAIVRDQIGIAFEARIHKLKIDKLDENRSAVELGDYETLKEKDRSSRQQAFRMLMEGFGESAIEKAFADQAARMNQEFDEKVRVSKLEFDNAVEAIKAKAEENKQALSNEIDRRFHEFSPAGFEEAKNKAEEALTKARAGYELADEVKNIADNNSVIFAGLADKVNKQEDKLTNAVTDLKRYSREETQSQITQRFQDFTRDNEAKLAEYKQGVDGRLTTLASQIAGKVTQADFQRVRETSQLYERILGTTEQGVADNASRLVMSSQIFQTEVGKYSTTGGPNLLRNSRADDGLKYWNGAPNEFQFREHEFYMNGQKRMFLLNSGAFVYGQRFIFKRNTDYILNLLAFDANTARVRITLRKRKKDSTDLDYDEVQTIFDKTGSPAFSSERAVKRSFKFNTGDFDNGYLVFQYFGNSSGWSGMFMTELDFYEGSNDRKWQPAPEDSVEPIEAVRTKVTQLAGSWAVQNLTSAGSIASQINTNANNILIEASKIRLKGSTLADEITAIDGRFKRLFVGEGNFATLNTDVLRSNSISGDKLAIDQALIDKLVASDVFTNTLSAKNAFITKLRSTIVSATLLEGYKGRIGGFQIGTHEKDPHSYWLTGLNQFKVGIGSGDGRWGQTALWVNWGNNWNSPGDTAWYVRNDGKMFCYNQAEFWNTPIIHGNLKVSGNIYYITDDNSKQGGYWIHSPSFKRIEEKAGYAYLYHFDDSYVWFSLNKDVSDRRYKSNIENSQVSALDVIERLKTYSYRKEFKGKIEDISCGIMAQDVQKYAPEAFYENPDGVYSYNTFALVPYLIKAIQELNQKVERLETTT